ncbi:MAG: nucleotidyltransferase domain-containing protein [Leifsonia sp.]|nr:nucleotidyltransferase domain-containing protein [Leifsonia sp.]
MSTPPPDTANVALRFCDTDYPGATTVVLGGSSSTGRRTATSDIDILLIAPAATFAGADPTAGDRVAHGEARVAHRDGERIDVFAYTVEGYRDWADRDFASLRPVLPYLLTEGVPLRTGTEFGELRQWSAERLARGPRLSDHKLELRRYAVTDLIDDLADDTDRLTAAAIRADLFRALGELALLTAKAWLGSGKWLARRLAAADPSAAAQLTDFAAEPGNTQAAAIASGLLERLGGRVDEDLTR